MSPQYKPTATISGKQATSKSNFTHLSVLKKYLCQGSRKFYQSCLNTAKAPRYTYLTAVEMTSDFTLDSRESNVTVHRTYNKNELKSKINPSQTFQPSQMLLLKKKKKELAQQQMRCQHLPLVQIFISITQTYS